MPTPNPNRTALWFVGLCCFAQLGASQTELANGSSTAEPEQIEFFETQIRPLLIEHCLECHANDTEASGGLLLDSRPNWERGGDSGDAIVPNDPAASLLMRAVLYDDPDLQMPPDGKLPAATIAALRNWIEKGAADPRMEVSVKPSNSKALPVADAQQHWAYRPLTKPQLPIETSSSTAVDRFIDTKLMATGLQAAPIASRVQWLRRMTFDLHGLPPDPIMLEAFEADDSPDAEARIVDRLLDSPRFGETFARHWMDVARYAESVTLRGFVLPEAWRYRDYLIEAFNDDRPFDQMIVEQVAGDLLESKDRQERTRQMVATSFLTFGNTNLEEQDKTQLEMDYIDEQLEVLGRAFLAQTIGCARCHDHKFDPIPTRDYYALAGIFRNTVAMEHENVSKWVEQPLPIEPDQAAVFDKLSADVSQLTQKIAALKKKNGSDVNPNKSVDIATLEGTQAFVPVSNNESDGRVVIDAIQFLPDGADNVAKIAPDKRADSKPKAAVDENELKNLEKDLAALKVRLAARPRFMTVREQTPAKDIPIYVRGNVHSLGEIVPRGFLTALDIGNSSQAKFDEHSSGRLQLARWLSDTRNPLTARVYANRVWSWLIGQGLVTTTNNFGTTGAEPSHPELLDWLADELMRSGWSTKHLVRCIVLSNIYRRSVVDAISDAQRADPNNQLLWRGNLRRVTVEALRDAMLSASGELDESVGGSMIKPGVKEDYNYSHQLTRRSLYHPVLRNALPELFEEFDFADTSVSIGERARSTVAPQALIMMNHPWVVARAEATAKLIEREFSSAELAVEHLHRVCFGRSATKDELAACVAYIAEGNGSKLDSKRLAGLVQSMFASLDFRYLE